MQTTVFTLNADTWVEILGGNSLLSLQIRTANKIRLHFNNSLTPPDSDAPYFLIDSFPPRFDFEVAGQLGQSHVWAKADVTPAEIVVLRQST